MDRDLERSAAQVAVFTPLVVPLVARHPFTFAFGDVLLVTEATTTRSNIRMPLVVAVAAALVPAIPGCSFAPVDQRAAGL